MGWRRWGAAWITWLRSGHSAGGIGKVRSPRRAGATAVLCLSAASASAALWKDTLCMPQPEGPSSSSRQSSTTTPSPPPNSAPARPPAHLVPEGAPLAPLIYDVCLHHHTAILRGGRRPSAQAGRRTGMAAAGQGRCGAWAAFNSLCTPCPRWRGHPQSQRARSLGTSAPISYAARYLRPSCIPKRYQSSQGAVEWRPAASKAPQHRLTGRGGTAMPPCCTAPFSAPCPCSLITAVTYAFCYRL